MCAHIWRIIFFVICLTYNTESQKQKQRGETTFIALDEFKVDLLNQDFFLKFNHSLPSNHHIWMEFMLKRPVDEISIKMKFDVIKKDNRIANFMNYDFDGCKSLDFFSSKVKAKKLAAVEFLKSTNLPKKCPILANKLYYIRNFTIDPKNYPPMLAMHWQVTMNAFLGKKFLGLIVMKGEVRKQ